MSELLAIMPARRSGILTGVKWPAGCRVPGVDNGSSERPENTVRRPRQNFREQSPFRLTIVKQ